MPGRNWPIMVIKEMKRLRTRSVWTEPRPVYLAAGLVVTAALLMLVVVAGIKQPAQPVPVAPLARQEGAAQPQPVLKAEAPAAPTGLPLAQEGALAAARPQPRAAPRVAVAGEAILAYGWHLHPLYGDWRFHPGVDIAAPEGKPVVAVWSGRVSGVYTDRHYGLTVAVAGGDYTVYYGALAEVKVEPNQEVTAGMIVGRVGQAGSEPYPHLHLAVKKGDKLFDPREIWAKPE